MALRKGTHLIDENPTLRGTNMYYNKRTKTVKHFIDEKHTFEPQKYSIIPLWYIENDLTYEDVENRQEVDTKSCKLGSKIIYHKIDQSLQPSNPEFPNHFYWGTLKLSFSDVFDPAVSGVHSSYADNGSQASVETSGITYIGIKNIGGTEWAPGTDSLSNKTPPFDEGIRGVMKDDMFKHFVSLSRKQTVYDDNYLFSDRKMRVPGKVSRINPGTFYGLWVYNDNPAVSGANTLLYHIKSEFTESVIET